jgi:predicted secreted protein
MADPTRNSIRLALSVWAAAQRRARTVGPAAAAFEAGMPGPIRGDERFQYALEVAETAGSLQRAMALNEDETKEWSSSAVVLLRVIKTADDVYERELDEALNAYYRSVTGAGH